MSIEEYADRHLDEGRYRSLTNDLRVYYCINGIEIIVPEHKNYQHASSRLIIEELKKLSKVQLAMLGIDE